MNCQSCREWIEDAALGALDTVRLAQLEAHLVGCAQCRLAFEAEQRLFAAINQGVAAAVEGSPSPDFAARVRVRLDREGQPAGFRFWRKSWIPVFGLAALALLIVTVWFVRRPSPAPKPQTARTTAPVAPAHAVAPEIRPEPGLSARLQSRVTKRAYREQEHQPGVGMAQNPQLEVLVEPGQWAAITYLYRASQAGRLNEDALMRKPSSGEEPFQVKPVEVAPLVIAELEDPKPVGEEDH